MNKRFKCSRLSMTAGGVALLALLSALGLHLSITRAINLQRNEKKAVEDVLLAEIAARDCFSEKKLKALDAEVSRFRNGLGDAGAWPCLSAEFDKGWSREIGPKDDGGEYSIQNYTLKKEMPKATDWPGILETIRRAESIQGVSVAEFKMKISDGPRSQPEDFVSLNVEVRSRRGLASNVSR
jgi:hypothetical protein